MIILLFQRSYKFFGYKWWMKKLQAFIAPKRFKRQKKISKQIFKKNIFGGEGRCLGRWQTHLPRVGSSPGVSCASAAAGDARMSREWVLQCCGAEAHTFENSKRKNWTPDGSIRGEGNDALGMIHEILFIFCECFIIFEKKNQLSLGGYYFLNKFLVAS